MMREIRWGMLKLHWYDWGIIRLLNVAWKIVCWAKGLDSRLRGNDKEVKR